MDGVAVELLGRHRRARPGRCAGPADRAPAEAGTAPRPAIHRNTPLYRLAKIEELSTRAVRDPRTAMTPYLACLADAL
ncbi:helix-turn-helix domain-containing protein [Streptomyces mirabilis]|nr:helix-turn-helix domain-containing protein [Streptomyces mirabilis]